LRDDHPALPPRVARPWLAGAALVWALAGVLGGVGEQPAPAGWIESGGVTLTAPRDGPYGRWALVAAGDHDLLLELDDTVEFDPGDQVEFSGMSDGRSGRVAGRAHDSAVDVTELKVLSTGGSIPQRLGEAVRQRVLTRMEPYDEGRGLLAGFLIGDTGRLSESDTVAMRRSGLAHFVAVSGSNVALFLALVFLAAGPLATGPRRRALLGLAGLPIYAAATGFEPSVMRASVMAGLALGGRLLGVVLETWQLLSLAVVILLLADHELAGSLGFQLSVAATAGVVVGARWPVAGSRLSRALAVTMGAQLAVAPLLLAAFGSVPLFSPLANLFAAPLVAASTMLGAVGVAGPGFLIEVAPGSQRSCSGWPGEPPPGRSSVPGVCSRFWRR
jgi:competence protein ComEC